MTRCYNINLTHREKRATNSEMQQFFDARAGQWDEHMVVDELLIRSMLKLAGLTKNAAIMDIACGTGVLAPFLLETCPSRLDAIDLSEKMIAIAKSKHMEHGVNWIHGDFLLFEHDVQYDFAVIYNAYPHFINKALFAQKLHHILKEGGRFAIMHGRGREAINACHKSVEVSPLSTPLRTCREERCSFRDLFQIDVQADTDLYYMISGVKRPADA